LPIAAGLSGEPPSEGSATVLGCFIPTNASVVAAATKAIRAERLRISLSMGSGVTLRPTQPLRKVLRS
jgi:hypothetical protein